MRKNLAIATLLIIAYSATIPINLFLKNNFMSKKNPDIIQNIFGGFRDTVSAWSIIKGEEYFHSGLPFLKAEAFHEGGSALMEERSQATGGASHEHGETHHGENIIKKDFFLRVYSSVRLTQDSHLTGVEEKEVLPWFYTAVLFDPHNITAYLLGGYWFERLGKPAEALKFLLEGLKNNPRSAQIISAIGEIYYRRHSLKEAIEYLERARSLWIEGKPPNVVSNTYTDSDRFFTFNVLGDIYEGNNNYAKAIELYREYNSIVAKPDPLMLKSIKTLEEKIKKP